MNLENRPETLPYYTQLTESNKNCLQDLRTLIKSENSSITETITPDLVSFSYQDKTFSCFWIDSQTDEPYLLFSEKYHCNHGVLQKPCRCMNPYHINPDLSLPVQSIKSLINKSLDNLNVHPE